MEADKAMSITGGSFSFQQGKPKMRSVFDNNKISGKHDI